jgi:hypothetical protein
MDKTYSRCWSITTAPSVGLGTLAWIALIVLKALGHIGLSWFLVITSIIWIPIALTIALTIAIGIPVVIVLVIAAIIASQL